MNSNYENDKIYTLKIKVKKNRMNKQTKTITYNSNY